MQLISVSGVIYEMFGHEEKFLFELADSSLIASTVLSDDRQWFVLDRVEEKFHEAFDMIHIDGLYQKQCKERELHVSSDS